MAILFAGSARCVVCGEFFIESDDGVVFPSFETSDADLARFSGSGVHYACMSAHPRVEDLRSIFLEGFGADGTGPNGNTVITLDTDTRARWSKRRGMLCVVYRPLVLLFEAPLASLVRMPFWAQGSEGIDVLGRHEEPGIGISVYPDGARLHLQIDICGTAFGPSEAPRATLRRLSRTVARELVNGWRRSVHSAILWARS